MISIEILIGTLFVLALLVINYLLEARRSRNYLAKRRALEEREREIREELKRRAQRRGWPADEAPVAPPPLGSDRRMVQARSTRFDRSEAADGLLDPTNPTNLLNPASPWFHAAHGGSSGGDSGGSS